VEALCGFIVARLAAFGSINAEEPDVSVSADKGISIDDPMDGNVRAI
jgi:hypothetical protein